MHTTTEQVWETFHVPLQQFIRRRVSDDATAEDLLQDVFLDIHQHIDTLRDVKKLESWIYQVTRNAIIDYYRSKRATTTLDVPEALQISEELPDEDIVTELFPSVRAMVLSLPTKDRQALILTEYQGLTQKELAERLGLSLSGARVACAACTRETQATVVGLLPLRAGSAWPHHRLSTTLRLLHDGRLLCRGSHSSDQERTCASFLKQLRLPE